jgi:hypothetical protein
MLAYAVSFCLVAVSSAGGSFMFGFLCAFHRLVGPLMNARFFAGSAAEYVPFLITGWINIAFLATVAIRWRGGNQPAFKILRTTTLLMIPFCWIVLYNGISTHGKDMPLDREHGGRTVFGARLRAV